MTNNDPRYAAAKVAVELYALVLEALGVTAEDSRGNVERACALSAAASAVLIHSSLAVHPDDVENIEDAVQMGEVDSPADLLRILDEIKAEALESAESC